jgi:hypothetical protein
MSITSYRANEPLYLVIIRHNNAEKLLKEWAQSSRTDVSIDNNRMRLFEDKSLNLFQVTWSHSWDMVTIWDYWNKRHIYF